MIEAFDTSHIQEKYLSGDFKIIKFNTEFPISEFKIVIEDFIKKYGLAAKDGYTNYKAIALQYSDESNPFFDAVLSSDYAKKEKKIFFKKNELANALDRIYAQFSSIRLSRGRVIVAEPGFKMVEHVDGAHINTLHIPITTSKNAGIVVGGEDFHLPADGSTYLINATIPHYAYNESSFESRMHITFPIGPPSFKKWKRSELIRFEEYFKMMKLPIEAFNLEISED